MQISTSRMTASVCNLHAYMACDFQSPLRFFCSDVGHVLAWAKTPWKSSVEYLLHVGRACPAVILLVHPEQFVNIILRNSFRHRIDAVTA